MKFTVASQYNMSPEELLIIAIFLQACRDLCCKFVKWHEDARDFLLREGFTDEDIANIKEIWSDDLFKK